MNTRIKHLLDRVVDSKNGNIDFTVMNIDTLEHSTVVRVLLKGGDYESLIIKHSTHDSQIFSAIREARFYKNFAPILSSNLCPNCYLAEENESGAAIVLEDLVGRYSSCGETPNRLQIRNFVMALGKLHASSRNISNLSERWSTTFASHPYNTIMGRLQISPAGIEAFLQSYGESIDKKITALLDRFFFLKDLLRHIPQDTIIHGDAHFWNALYSNNNKRLIDWGSVCLGFGEIDLAHAIAMNLPRKISRDLESQILQDYCEQLGNLGESIELEMINYRYKLGILYTISSIINMWHFGVPIDILRPLFKNVTTAGKELELSRIS